MVSKTLTAESTNEQGKAGLTDCTPEEFATIQQLNADYNAKFGFPFILAVRGPRGTGLAQARDHRHLRAPAATTIRTSSWPRRCATSTASPRSASTTSSASSPTLGNRRVGLAGAAGRASATRATPRRASSPSPTSPMRTAPARSRSRDWMREAASTRWRSMRSATWSALRRRSAAARRRCSPASHYDTVRNGGKYDGRLGIFVPMACVRELTRQGRRLPFGLRGGRLRRRGRPALQGHLPRLGRADRPLRTQRGSTRRTPTASPCARRWQHAGLQG